jgi:hypothetical protein
MAVDPATTEQLKRALDNASTAAKAAGEALDDISRLYVAADKAARASLKPQVDREIKRYQNLTAQVAALVQMLNALEA